MPERPKQMGMMEIVMANVMARRIQNVWIIYQLEKRIRNEEQQSQEYMNRLSTLENNDMAQIGNLDYLYRDGNVDLVDGK